MDAVITYVDNSKRQWQESWAKTVGRPQDAERFRDWGTLRYLLRGIAQYMPFIEKVHLVVSHQTQVPNWVNRETVHIVTHREIIPAQLLPTFNSNVIEFWFHRIRGIGEEVVYFNDDMFPVGPLSPEDFFLDGKACTHVMKRNGVNTIFQNYLKNATDLALDLAGKPRLPKDCYFRLRHGTTPMLMSAYREVMEKGHDALMMSFTRIRDWVNVCQYVFVFYAWLTGRTVDRITPSKYLSLCAETADKAARAILDPPEKMLCLNDNCEWECFEDVRDKIVDAFETAFPEPCRYERAVLSREDVVD